MILKNFKVICEKIQKILKSICAWWVGRRVQSLYNAYSDSLMPNIYDGIERRNLPEKTMRLRHEFNKAVALLKRLEPETTWKIMN